MSKKIFLIIYLFPLLVSNSCMDDSQLWDFERLNVSLKTKGVFIVNEGMFGSSSASLSYYNPETKKVLNDVFFQTNALPLGDVANSMTIVDSTAFIVLNNSGKVYVMNSNSFEYIGKITGLNSPRYLHFVNPNKAYITDLTAKSIYVVNPKSFELIDKINLDNSNSDYYQHSTEQMLQVENLIFVSCWSYDNKILIIDSETDKLIDSIEVAKQPNSIQLDKYNRLWVLSDGAYAGSSYGQDTAALTCINTRNFQVEKEFKFRDLEASPRSLQINSGKDTLYYIHGNWSGDLEHSGVYQMPINAAILPNEPFISQNEELFYALGIDPSNSDIYISDAIDYSRSGMVYRFNSKAQAVDTFKVGIIPGNFAFKMSQ